MNGNNNYIDILVGKIVSGNATADEVNELEKCVASAEENRSLFDKSKKIWEKGDHFIPAESLQKDNASLVAEYNRYLSGKIKKTRKKSLIYRIAAILAFPVALTMGWYSADFWGNLRQPQEQLCEVISPRGHVSKCILPDGTEVWINTGSSITYNTVSFNQKKREVRLQGEAYFEVQSNPEKPFDVITPQAHVLVTGTAFNVMASPAGSIFEAVLANGSVKVEFTKGSFDAVDMKPGERVVFDASTGKYNVQQVEAEMYTSWRNGEIIFKDATLNDLIHELERIYNIRFHLQPENMGALRFRGMFSYKNNLIEALEKIKKTASIDYYIENKEVWLKKSN